MKSKAFRISALLLIIISDPCHAQAKSDSDLLRIAHQSFDKWKSAKTEQDRIKVMREEMAALSDAERTRAIALRIFNIDSKDYGLNRYNAPSSAERVLKDDPSLITDSAELKRLISKETDARRFYILAMMANQLISSQKSDFVVEMAPMLYRREPLADMPGEYQVESLTNASWFTYGMIVKNLKVLGADFAPPNEALPYPEKIPILVKWLKGNWPGCDALGEATELSGVGSPALRQDKRSHAMPSNQSSKSAILSNTPWWCVLAASILLVAAIVFWLRSRLTKRSLMP